MSDSSADPPEEVVYLDVADALEIFGAIIGGTERRRLISCVIARRWRVRLRAPSTRGIVMLDASLA